MQPISFPGRSTAQHDDERELQPELANRSRPLAHARDATSRTQLRYSAASFVRDPGPENTAGSTASSTMPEVHFIDEECDRSPLLLAARDNDFVGLAALLDAGADVNYSDPVTRTTALMRASERWNVEAVSLLLAQKGIDIDRTDFLGENALMAAISYVCAPVANAITLGWQGAIAAVCEAPIISADGVALEPSTAAWQRHVVLQAQAIFSGELLR